MIERERSAELVPIGEILDVLMADLEVVLFIEGLVADQEREGADR